MEVVGVVVGTKRFLKMKELVPFRREFSTLCIEG